ncbi:MAG: UrcA family protein [Caulobacteraceae bacterium]
MFRTVLASTAALVLAATAAHAAPQDTNPQVTVHMKDLDLSRPGDVAHLIKRLSSASVEVCGGGNGVSTAVSQAIEHSACYKAAMDAAVSAAHSPGVELAYRHGSREQFAAR